MTTYDTTTPTARLHAYPTDRALGETQVLDLPAALAHLRSEPHEAAHSHRQVTLFQHGPVTVILIAIDANGILPTHCAHGVVTIQAIDGSITVQAGDQSYTLEPQQSLMLTPDMPHDVRAPIASALLVTICLADAQAPAFMAEHRRASPSTGQRDGLLHPATSASAGHEPSPRSPA